MMGVQELELPWDAAGELVHTRSHRIRKGMRVMQKLSHCLYSEDILRWSTSEAGLGLPSRSASSLDPQQPCGISIARL